MSFGVWPAAADPPTTTNIRKGFRRGRMKVTQGARNWWPILSTGKIFWRLAPPPPLFATKQFPGHTERAEIPRVSYLVGPPLPPPDLVHHVSDCAPLPRVSATPWHVV